MNSSIGHTVLSSIKEYVNYRLLKDYSAYYTTGTRLYSYSDPRFQNKYVYGSPYGSFVYNSGVSGPTICSGITTTGGFSPKSTGLFVDHQNGRVISNSGISGTISGTYSVPNFNIYVTTYSDYKLVAETNYKTPPYNTSPTGAMAPYSYTLPAIFIRLSSSENEELSFGGNEMSNFSIKMTALAKSNYELTLLSDLFRDLENRMVPLLTGTPLNEYGELKSGWNYSEMLNNPSSYGFITDSRFNHFENDTFVENNPSLEVGMGIINFQVQRNPRSLFP